MPRLTRRDETDHERAEKLLALPRELTEDEIMEVFEKFHPGARHLQAKNAAFFTPYTVADVVARNTSIRGNRVLDLGAGIGMLTWAMFKWAYWEPAEEIVCIELNPEYVEVGRRLVPQATWICGDMFNLDLLRSLGKFDAVVCNPPFGKGNSGDADKSWLSVKSPLHFQALEVGLRMSDGAATFVLPRVDLPWLYSMYPEDVDLAKKFAGARRGHEFVDPDRHSQNLRRFLKAFPEAHFGCVSEDVALYVDEWKNVHARVEVVNVGFEPSSVRCSLPEPEKPTGISIPVLTDIHAPAKGELVQPALL